MARDEAKQKMGPESKVDRRTFVKGGVSGGVVAGLASGIGARAAVASGLAGGKAPARKPNVLYVFDDQHRFASLPGEPFAQVLAPNIDKFRRANMSMDQCISNYPLCCPYRAIMMTGKYSPENGVTNNATAMRLSEFTLSKAFKQAGYRTSYVGKWHLAGDHDDHFKFIPEGPGRVEIDDWHIWEDTNNHYHCYTFDSKTGKQIPATTWAPVNMTDEAVGLLKSYAEKKDQPWILWVSYNPPHPPFNPPENDAALNPVQQQKYRPNVVANGSGPKWMKSLETYHHAMQGYLGGISGIDAEFARILKALDESGMADDTIVIFTSDHGEMMGSQGKGGKIVPWEESNHVPFMVRYPGVTPKGGSSTQLFAAVDIYPTVCGLAGIPVPAHCSGHDLSDIMRGKKIANAPDTVFLMGAPGGDGGDEAAGTPENATGEVENSPPAAVGKKGKGGRKGEGSPLYYRGVRTAQYTYTVREDGRWLLYDNVADPYQMKNLVNDPGHKGVMEGFDGQIQGWIKKTGDVFVYPRV